MRVRLLLLLPALFALLAQPAAAGITTTSFTATLFAADQVCVNNHFRCDSHNEFLSKPDGSDSFTHSFPEPHATATNGGGEDANADASADFDVKLTVAGSELTFSARGASTTAAETAPVAGRPAQASGDAESEAIVHFTTDQQLHYEFSGTGSASAGPGADSRPSTMALQGVLSTQVFFQGGKLVGGALSGTMLPGDYTIRVAIDASSVIQPRGTPGSASAAAAGDFRLTLTPVVPVIFVPGFLASQLHCGAKDLWLPIPPKLGALGLAPDGVTDAGDGTCSGPVQASGVIDSVLGSDIHGSTLKFLERIAPNANYIYAWDWRKSPREALAGLDALVDQVRSDNSSPDVAILAHSYGGLLTRLYIDNPTRAVKVARALFVGTPSWGSPKALFPLATGQETPAGSVGLDSVLDNDDLKSLARNLAGAYTLYPDDHYGKWLTVLGRTPSHLDTDPELTDYVDTDLLGNGPLLQDALDLHANVLDGWKTNGVDLRAIVGTGLNTVISMVLEPGAPGASDDKAQLRFGNGDETVPARSATQGDPGTNDPLGENIPIRYLCGVSHVPLVSDAALTSAGVAGFLEHGNELSVPDQPCANGGFVIQLFDVNLDPVAPSAPNRATNAAAGASAGDAVLAAEAAGDIDVIRFPGVDYIVTDDRHPVHLAIPDSAAHMVVRRLDGDAEGPPQSVDAQPGGLVLDTTAAKTIAVAPLNPPASVQPTPTPATPAQPAPPRPPAADRSAPRVTISVRRSHGRFLVTLRATDPAGIRRIEYRLTAKGAFRTYHGRLRLTRKQLKALRVRATDKAGNTSKPIAAKLPR
jgi:hypothetical protein